ncbi:NAD-dependent epimerase/dehydratase family protein [Candidatus Parcubacteria bacterium]|nr:MAG: NAD-dependent epimerase/dehydratase family protein [Candidatus Parcubacteria bacterium]
MSERLTIAVLGGHGMLGADLVKFLGTRYSVTPITRENYSAHKGGEFDVFINANGNSKRFWANQHPYEDFLASTVSAYDSVVDFKFRKYVYISSIVVYEDPSGLSGTIEEREINPSNLQPYGFHKYLSELIVRHAAKDYLILRCPIVLGSSLKKGTFYDILNGRPLFVTLDSKLQLITTRAVAEIIAVLLERGTSRAVFNVGGLGTFPLKEASRYFGRPVVVSENAEKQIYEMDVSKVRAIYPLKKSEEYLQEFLKST